MSVSARNERNSPTNIQKPEVFNLNESFLTKNSALEEFSAFKRPNFSINSHVKKFYLIKQLLKEKYKCNSNSPKNFIEKTNEFMFETKRKPLKKQVAEQREKILEMFKEVEILYKFEDFHCPRALDVSFRIISLLKK